MSNETTPGSGHNGTGPIVGLVMGSDSDWPVMEAAADALAEFGIPFEADVVSAHRMPTEMIRYGQTAHERGLRVIIAGAGGAAHLPGMLASVTPLPVIGVPVPLPVPLWPGPGVVSVLMRSPRKSVLVLRTEPGRRGWWLPRGWRAAGPSPRHRWSPPPG